MTITITINDRNETPTDITLTPSSVDENVGANTVVGTLTTTDPDAGNTFTYTLVAGTGSTDNVSFNIDGSSLRITNSPDYETKSSYSVRIRTTDQGTLFFEKSFTITINNINEPPTDITLTATSLNQSGGLDAVVGTLGTTDVDNADSFTYTLVSGDGDTNNLLFNISGSALRANNASSLAAGTYSVRVRTTDSGNATYDEAFTITVADNVAPMVSTVSVPANGTYKVGQNLDFTVNYNENVTVDTSHGTPYITVVIGDMTRQLDYVSGSGSSALVFRYTVQASDGSSVGIGAAILPNGGTLQDAAGNNANPTLLNVSSAAGISIDTTAPAVSSIVRQSPSNSLSNAASVIFRITFNESVTGVDISDFSLTKTGTAEGAVDSLSSVSGTIYDVTVNTIPGDGTLRLDLNASGTGIKDAVENPIAEGYSTGETYSIDNTAPTVTISMSKTAFYSAETATVTITFSEAVTGFTNDDLTVPNATLTAVSSADGGMTWTATFTAANVNAATNAIVLALTGITDTAGNSGSGTASSGNYTVSMPTVPSAPTGVTATAGDTQASVSFTAPVSNGGAPITDYTVTVNPAGVAPVNGAGSPIVVTGLTNGQAYTFTVTATNSVGTGTASAASNSVTPRAAQTITFSNPGAQNFGTSPTLTATSDSGLTVTFTSETPEVCTVTSGGVLTFINAGTATITANQAGDGSYLPAPSVSRTFTVNPVAPGASTGVAATAGNAQASVSFSTPVSNGGASITSYTVTSSPGGVTATGAGSPITVTGLTNGVAYTFTVTATNGAGTGTASAASNSVTPQAPVYDNTPSTPSTNSAVVEVNGEKQDAGTSSTTTTDGQRVTTITVDDTKLDRILESSGEKPTVTLPSTGSAVTVGELNGQTVKNMENKEATLEIKTDTVTYTLPASQINIDAVSSLFGSQVGLKDIKVSVKIAEPAADTVRIVEDTASKGGYQLVVKPVAFEITCTNGDQTVEVSRFNGYVERTITIPDGIDPSKITTGIVLDADGTFSHVPTQIIVIDGKYYAKINSLTNSTYSVVYNPVIFSDMASHWAKEAVNDMGSRMVVTGIGNGIYEPERSITRAEFAAIVVRALGLKKGSTESAFGDVALTDWFNGYVGTATSYALITGYDSTKYAPNDTITREQAMTILARSMKLTGLSVTFTDSESSALLANYSDAGLISDYARAGAAACVKTGVVSGTTASTLSPKDSVTRAEVAVMVSRLLEKSGLI